MNISYEGKDYAFDLDEIDVDQATLIKRKFNLNLLGLEAGLREGDPDSLRAIYWLMLAQNGERANIDNVKFKIVKFSNAIQTANLQEIEKAEAEAAADPKEPAA